MVNDVKSSCLAKVWKTCTSFPVFHIWQYWVMLVVVFLCGVSGYVPLTFLADRAAKEGDIPQHDTQHLITIAGGCNLVGRLLAGFISDQKFCNRKLLYSTAYIISGLGTVFSIFCHNFISFALYGAVYGFTGGKEIRSIIAVAKNAKYELSDIMHMKGTYADKGNRMDELLVR